MKILAENNNYKLCYFPDMVNCYHVYRVGSISPSGEVTLPAIVARAFIFTKKIKSYFTSAQIDNVRAKVAAIKYVGRKFKV